MGILHNNNTATQTTNMTTTILRGLISIILSLCDHICNMVTIPPVPALLGKLSFLVWFFFFDILYVKTLWLHYHAARHLFFVVIYKHMTTWVRQNWVFVKKNIYIYMNFFLFVGSKHELSWPQQSNQFIWNIWENFLIDNFKSYFECFIQKSV